MSAKNETAAVAVINPHEMIMAAINGNVDAAVLGRMMDLQERYDAMQAKKAFTEAMTRFKATCPSVIDKDKAVNFGAGKASFNHASIGHLVETVTPHLSANGLSIRWETAQEAGHVSVSCIVEHENGHREVTKLTGPRDESGGKNPIQTVGSSVTYLQRYTLVAALGLATADQDDADATKPARKPVSKPVEVKETKTDLNDLFVSGVVEKVESRSGEKNGKPWTKYGIHIAGQVIGTFDTAIGQDATEAQGATVTITYTDDGKYKTATGITLEDNKDDNNLPL